MAVGKFVGFLEGRRRGDGSHLLLEVEGDVAELLLDVTDDFPLSGGGEGVATLFQDLREVVCEIAAGQDKTEDDVGLGVAFVDLRSLAQNQWFVLRRTGTALPGWSRTWRVC